MYLSNEMNELWKYCLRRDIEEKVIKKDTNM